MEKAPEPQDDSFKVEPLPSHLSTLSSAPPHNNLVSRLIGLESSHIFTLKADLVRNAARKLAETLFPLNSPFTGLVSGTIPVSSSKLEEAKAKISSRKVLLVLIAIGAGILAFRSSQLFISFLVLLWLVLVHLWSLLETEERHIKLCQDLAPEFATLSPTFEKYCAKVRSSLQLIQEVELVSRGYRITTTLSPISRLEENAKVRRCQLLRRETFSSLNSIITLLQSTLLSPNLLYIPPEIAAARSSTQQDAGEAKISILKAMDQIVKIGLHTYAEELILYHCKMSLSDQSTWSLTTLPTFSELYKTASHFSAVVTAFKSQHEAITTALAFQETWVIPDGADTKKEGKILKEEAKLQKSFLEHLNTLQSALQTQVAQVVLCKDLLSKLEADPTETMDAIVKTFSSLKSLEFSVTTSGESASHALDRLLQRLKSDPDADLSSLEARPSSNFGNFESLSDPSSTAPGSDSSYIGSFLDFIPKSASVKESVFEAETGAEEEEEVQRSTLTREERIVLAKRAREDARKKEEDMFAKLNFVMELKDVLNSRVEERERMANETPLDLQ